MDLQSSVLFNFSPNNIRNLLQKKNLKTILKNKTNIGYSCIRNYSYPDLRQIIRQIKPDIRQIKPDIRQIKPDIRKIKPDIRPDTSYIKEARYGYEPSIRSSLSQLL